MVMWFGVFDFKHNLKQCKIKVKITYCLFTVETELMAAAPIRFHEILVQNLLSKNHVLLKGAALIKVRPLIPFLR